jgi:RNA polymerase sigma factor (sigma-70 family)
MTSPASRVVQHLRQLYLGDVAALRDGQLLQRFADASDEQAFAALVHRHGPLVLGVCRRILQNLHDAEDAFQATFLVLARRASAIRKPDSLASWLYEVAYRLARKMRADLSKRRQRETKVPPPAPVAPVDLTGRELQTILDEELHHLADKYRQPLLLCYLEGLTQEEAAGQLGWPRGTLKRRLERGREMLKGQLNRRGLGLGAAIAVTLPAGEALAIPVPLALRANTAQAALLFAARQVPPAGLTSGRVVALAEAALKSLLGSKIRVFVGLVLLAGLLSGATTLWLPREVASSGSAAVQPETGRLVEAPQQTTPVTLAVEVPKNRPTVGEFNDGQYQVTVQLKNVSDKEAVVWAYFTVKLLDAGGKAVNPVLRQGKYGSRSAERSILEEMDFVTLKAGQTHHVQVQFQQMGASDPESITSYQLPGQGEYIVEVNYQYGRAAAKKRFGEGAKDIDGSDRPWNRAVEFEKKVEVRIEVVADENEKTPQVRNRCPPERQPSAPPVCEIAETMRPLGIV